MKDRKHPARSLSAETRSLKTLLNVFFAYITSLQQELVFIQNKSYLFTECDDLIAIGLRLTVYADFRDAS